MPVHPFANPWALWLLTGLPLLALLGLLAAYRRRRALARLGSLIAVLALARRRAGWRRAVRGFGLFGGLTALILGVAGPQWGRDWEQATATGRDIIVLLDVSRSMLAQDVLPSRLGQAKEALRRFSYLLQQRGGQRVGLVVFAAYPELVCPLTHDYDHFRLAVADQDAAHLPVKLRPRAHGITSGTRMGGGLQAAVKALESGRSHAGLILMLSDGDDPARGEEWKEGARAARQKHVPVFTIGLGDPAPKYPTRIPWGDDFVRHPVTGRPVETKLEEQPLEGIARLTQGAYVRAGTGQLDLGTVYRDWIEPRVLRAGETTHFPRYVQRYPWFFGAALVLFALTLLPGSPRTTEARDKTAPEVLAKEEGRATGPAVEEERPTPVAVSP